MNRSRRLRALAVFIVLLMPFGFFIYFEMNKPAPLKPVPAFGNVPYFKLVDQYADTITSDDMKGYLYVADFFYTKCKDVCPKLSELLSGVQESYKKDLRVRTVSFTVDPESDSLSALRAYADLYEAKKYKWFFLTGSKEDIYRLAEKGFKVPVVQAANGEEGFTLSDKLIVVDADGKIRGNFSVISDPAQLDSMYNCIERLLVEK